MKRLHFMCLPGREASATLGIAATTTTASSSSALSSSSPLYEQKCGLRNLHQYPKARYKSLVKDTRRFSRNWWLTAGNNNELVHEFGHEREATENFGELRDDSDKDKYLLSTQRLEDLPPAERLNVLTVRMKVRFEVKDGNRGFDKAKMLLEALECFSEMRLSGQIKVFDQLPEPDQDTFLQYVEGCMKYAQACSHSHPDAVAVMIRTAQICDEMRCVEKRDEVTRMAELAAQRMDRAYAFKRTTEGIALNKPSMTEALAKRAHRDRTTLEERFKDTPWVLEDQKPRTEYMMGARKRKILFSPMKKSDTQTRMHQIHSNRIEE